jgi:hypothetical protein
VGPRAGLNAVVVKRKSPNPCREWNPGRPARNLVTVPTELSRLLPGCRWEDIFIMNLEEIWCEGMDWIHLAQDGDHWQLHVQTVINLRVVQNVGALLTD